MADKTGDKRSDPAGGHGGGGAHGPAHDKNPARHAGAAGAAGMMAKTPVMMGAVMILEALVLFAGFKFLGGTPKHAVAIELTAVDKGPEGKGIDAGTGKKKRAEISVVDFKAPNTQNGRRYIYDVSIFATVSGDAEQKVRDAIKERDALIRDRIRTIIAQMDPEKLGGGSEPGLETMRRQVKYQLDEIIGDGMIDEVLVPKCIPFRTEF
jgi:flagellar basal body-associated protein FliL